MALKMKELTDLTGESKSTILYYLKEGLLPQPIKPKPNVALYSESCVNIIKFIKYLQSRFGYSIAEIKHIFANNRFKFDNSFENLIKSINALALHGKESYSKEQFLQKAQISQELLEEFVSKGYIAKNSFGDKELEIADILKRAKEMGLDFALIERYVQSAKELAVLENDAGTKLLEDDSKEHNERYELLFDIILTLKPYIFNTHMVKEHQKRISDEKSL